MTVRGGHRVRSRTVRADLLPRARKRKLTRRLEKVLASLPKRNFGFPTHMDVKLEDDSLQELQKTEGPMQLVSSTIYLSSASKPLHARSRYFSRNASRATAAACDSRGMRCLDDYA
jgi:hypothetical protein